MESTPAAYAAAYRAAGDEAAALAASLSPAQFNWKPAPAVWSVAECLAHVNALNAPYLPAFERALAEGGPTGAPPFRYGPVARWFIAFTGPQPTRKVPTAPSMRPTPGTAYDPGRVMADFRALNDGFLAVLERAERARLDLSRVRMASPFLSLLRLPVGAFLEALAGHEHRHLAQARRVAAHPAFPR